jgi:hypothetical protein
MRVVVYLLCTAVGFAAGSYLPASAATPYVPLFVSYHLFLQYLIFHTRVTGEQKAGLSMSPPLAVISHLCFVAVLIGLVLERQQVPLFGLLQYFVPCLAPFEVIWLFKRTKAPHIRVESANAPRGTTMDDYAEFLEYTRQGRRRFQRPGRSLNDEFALWYRHRNKKRHLAATTQIAPA